MYVPSLRVDPDRIGRDLGDRRLARRRSAAAARRSRAARAPPRRAGSRAAPRRRRGRVREQRPGRADDRADGRVDLVGMRVDERAHRGVALGDEGAVVEQPAAARSGVDVDLDELGARLRQPRGDRLERCPGSRREPGQRRTRRGTPTRGCGGAASGASAGQPRSSGSPPSGPTITAIAASASLELARQHASRSPACGTQERRPVAGTRPRVGLIAHDAPGTRRDPPGARGVGAEREVGHAERDRDRRARARAARHVGRAGGRRAPRRAGCACRPARSRTGPCSSCRSRPRPAARRRATTGASSAGSYA